MKLINKTAIVTGGSQGIGKGIAIALANAGADVIIQYRQATDKALTVVEQIKQMGRNATAIQSDFTDKNAPEIFLESARTQLSPVTILVNSAAAYYRGGFMQLTAEQL